MSNPTYLCASCDYEVEADEISVVDPVVVWECVTDLRQRSRASRLKEWRHLMIKLRDPHDDAKLAMRELNDDIVVNLTTPCEHCRDSSLRLTCSTTRVSG